MRKIMGQNMGQLISKVGAILWDIDTKNLAVSLIKQTACISINVFEGPANRTKSKYRFGTVLYPIYPLMNSHCHCNTRCDISDKDLTLEIRAQVPIKAGEEVRESRVGEKSI